MTKYPCYAIITINEKAGMIIPGNNRESGAYHENIDP
jgi:hypothetical protein